jgi:hypothetical protein
MSESVTLSASVYLRPTRIGFLVRPDDMAAVRNVMQVCACLWGGIFNPIIPVGTALPEAWREEHSREISGSDLARGYIRFFEPDVFVEAQDGLAAEAGLPATEFGLSEPRTIPISVYADSNPDRAPRPFGTNVSHIYQDLYERDFRFVSRDGDRVAAVSTRGADGAFIEAVFGGFPTEGKLATTQRAYADVFKPIEIPADGDGFLRIVRDGLHFPLRFTRRGLKTDYNSSWRGPTLFVADPDSPLDLIDFWNLRLFHPSVLPISTRWFQAQRDFLAKYLTDSYRPLPRNPHGVMITPTIQFGRSIGEERANAMVAEAGLTALGECRWLFQTRYDSIWTDYSDEDHVTRPQPVSVAAAEADHDLTVGGGPEPMIRFPDLAPDFAPQHDSTSARWVNVVQLRNYGSDDRLALVLPSDFTDLKEWRFRLGESGIVAREGFVLPQRHKGLRQYLRLPDGTQAVATWLRARGVEAAPSDPGRIAEQILASVGGLRGSALLADPETLKLLDQMAKSVRRHADGTVEEFEDRAVDVDRWKALVHRRANTGFHHWISLDAFVKAKVLKLGLAIDCPNCMKRNWVGLAAMREQIACERCLKSFAFPQGTLDFDKTPWRYRVVGPFSVPDYAAGAYATVLALRVFSEMLGVGDTDLTYATGLQFSGMGPNPCEVDFTCWYRRRALFGRSEEPVLAFGEAKSFATEGFKTADIERMQKVADRFPGAFMVFATLKEDLSETEKSLIGDFAMRGRERLDNGRPRSPTIVLTGTELFTSWHIDHTWQERGGQHARFGEPVHMRLDNLWTLAEVTQQLYLGLPDPWAHLRQPPAQPATEPPDPASKDVP